MGRAGVFGRLVTGALAATLGLAAFGGTAAGADEVLTRTFLFTGAEQTLVVPAGVTSMSVRAIGGRGTGNSPAAEVDGTIAVTPGQTLYVEVGGNADGVQGGFNGGGEAGHPNQGGGGGGASDVRTAPASAGLRPDPRLLVAGGSGGEGSSGLPGGAAEAESEHGRFVPGGQPGTQREAGERGEALECVEGFGKEGTAKLGSRASLGSGGSGASCETKYHGGAAGGGGGGGYFGGGGGWAWVEIECGCGTTLEGGGGGGGSSLGPAGGTIALASSEAEPVVALTYTQPENPPAVLTGPASPVHGTNATLAGSVNPEGRATTCEFEYGTSVFYEYTAPCSSAPGSGLSAVAASAVVEGLTPSTTYHYRVVATNEYGTSYGADSEFTTRPHDPPTVTGISPAHGSTAGGTTVTLTGTGMEHVTSVTFASLVGTDVQHLSSTSLSVVTPYLWKQESVPVTLTDDLGDEVTEVSYGYYYPPSVTGVSIKKGPAAGGTTVEIKGSFAFSEATEVLFGSTAGTIVSQNRESITAVTPASPIGKYDVYVVGPGGPSLVSKKAVFTFLGLEVTGVSPASGPLAGGTSVTVTGAGFEPGSGGTAFEFHKTLATAVECSSTTQCTMIAPAGAKVGAVDVTAIVAGKKSKKASADRYTFE